MIPLTIPGWRKSWEAEIGRLDLTEATSERKTLFNMQEAACLLPQVGQKPRAKLLQHSIRQEKCRERVYP